MWPELFADDVTFARGRALLDAGEVNGRVTVNDGAELLFGGAVVVACYAYFWNWLD